MKKVITAVAAVLSAVICAAPSLSATASYCNEDFSAFGRFGDVNDDGRVDAIDASWTQAYYVGNAPAGFRDDMADVNSDGVIDLRDSTLMMDYYALISTHKVATGDVNSDGTIQLNDAVAIEQYIANPTKYPLRNKIKADVNKDGYINHLDAYAIQSYKLHLSDNIDVLYGDANNDGKIDPKDVDIIQNYWQRNRQPSKQDFARFNAYPDDKFDSKDYNAIWTRVFIGYYK